MTQTKVEPLKPSTVHSGPTTTNVAEARPDAKRAVAAALHRALAAGK